MSDASRLNRKLILKQVRSRIDALRKPAGEGINRHEHRVYSQHREDGIIRHILDRVGIRGGKCIEFGFGPIQANCLDLVLHRGFRGLFMDGNRDKCRELEGLLSRRQIESRVVNAFLTTDNIDVLIDDNGYRGDIAVLSVDVDGNDYWLWQAIECCDPVLVVAEYNASFGADRSVTVPYDPEFVRYQKHSSGLYHGASLAALARLGERKGYRLVGTDSTGVNAFFLHNNLATVELPGLSPQQAFRCHRGRTRHKGLSQEDQWQAIAHLPLQKV